MTADAACGVEFVDPGAQFHTLTFSCGCPQCAGPLRWVKEVNQVGLARRERRLLVECVKGTCPWTGRVVVSLEDLGSTGRRAS